MTGGGEGAPRAGVTIHLEIECSDEEVAKALEQALMPDNRYFPKDQRFRCGREGSVISFEIGSPRVRPALTTVDSIVSDAKLFGDVWVEARTRGLGSSAAQ